MPTLARARLLEISQQRSQERTRATRGSLEEMIKLEAARFLMGSEIEEGFPADGEGPVRAVQVDGFYIDRIPVTNAGFREFVERSGYITDAERFGWSFVFAGQLQAIASDDPSPAGLPWWRRIDGANWKHPEGPDSSAGDREPWTDASAYAEWAGKRLPTETEWELEAPADWSRNSIHGATN